MNDSGTHRELAVLLDRLAPAADAGVGDWDDVVSRFGRRPSQAARARRWRSRRVALVVAATALLVTAGAATAAYLALRGSPSPAGALPTIVADPRSPTDFQRIVVLDRTGRERTIWECPGRTFCGTVVSLAWAPRGNRLAMTLDEIGGLSRYVGVRILDFDRGTDDRIPVTVPDGPIGKIAIATRRAFGCVNPNRLAWSPDATRLAYVCPHDLTGRGRIFVVRADGTGRRPLHTGLGAVVDFPSWSRDGRMVFAARRDGRSAIYVIRAAGRGRRLLVSDATAPVWSPDGSAIAYSSERPGCKGIRILDVTAPVVAPDDGRCTTTAPPGIPSWSPDGRELAVGARDGIYIVSRGGGPATRVTRQKGIGGYGAASPTWSPPSTAPSATRPTSDACGPAGCF